MERDGRQESTVEVQFLLNAINAALITETPYVGGVGRGIVMVGGGRYLPSAYISLRHLRARGCQLPVQLWHLGPDEISPSAAGLLQSLGVDLIDAEQAQGAGEFRRLRGWECKVHAIVNCPFEQVLLLDADNIPIRDPTIIFDSDEFTKCGQVFWPDFHYGQGSPFAIQERAWSEFGISPQTGLELETGQLAVDRRRCWKELLVTRAMNANSDQCYQHFTWGDKDTFTLAWHLTERPYLRVPFRPQYVDRTAGLVLWQHWFDGTRMFQHQRKWFEPPDESSGRMLQGELCADESLAYQREYWAASRGWPFSAGEALDAQTSAPKRDSCLPVRRPRDHCRLHRIGCRFRMM